MATTSRYTLLGNGANFMDFYIPYGTISLGGQEIIFKGNSGVDAVYVGSSAGLIFDFTQAGLGVDQIYLDGNWADYSRAYSGSVVTLARATGGSETIKASSGDSLVFADGTVSVLNALNFIKGTAAEPVPAGATSTAFPMTVAGTLTNTVRAVVQDATGETIALNRPGVAMIVKGGSGVDVVYAAAGASIDGTQLGLGQDKLYLTGNWADYNGTYAGSVVTLTRTVGADTETVKFLGGSTTAYDSIVFADGAASSIDILNFVKGTAGAPALSLSEVTPLPGPSVTITTNDSALKVGETATITFTLSEAVTGFAADDITVSAGILTGFSGSGTSYTATFTPDSGFEGTATIGIAAEKFTSVADGKFNSASSLNLTLDTLAPAAATINAVAANDIVDATERAAGVTVTGTNEAGATVTLNGNAVTADTATTWSYGLTATEIDAFGQGAETLTVVSTDAAGNTTTSTRAISVDTVAPTLASSTPADNSTDVSGNSVVLTFSEAVAAGTGNIVISDGTNTANIAVTDATQVAINGDTVTIAPTAGFVQGASYNVQMASGVIADLVGNAYAGIADAATLDFTMTSKPTVLITSSDSALKIGDTAILTFTLSAASTNFTVADVTVNGGALSGFSGSGAVYMANYTPATNSTTPATVDIAAEMFTNAGGTGNLAAPQLVMTVDTIAPVVAITSSVLTNDTTPVVSGTAEAGSTVTAVIDGATYTATATGGNWSVDTATATPTSGALALNANGGNTVSVTAVDAAGNPTAAAATQTLVIDTTAPVAAAIDSVATNDVINASERDAGVTVTGANESGATVTLNGNAVTALNGVTWSYSLSAAAIDAFGQGAETLTVASTDAAGNTTNSTRAVSVDTVAPVVAITSTALTNVAAPTVSGTAEAGSTVTAVIAGATYTTTATGGNWSINTATASPISGTLSLNANGSNSVSVTAVDTAGNPTAAAATQTLVIDTTAPVAATIDNVATDNIIDATERAAGVIVTGTNESGATVTLNGNAVTPLTGTTWSYNLTTAAIDAFGQGAETLNIVSTDAAGNTTNSTKAVTVATRSVTYSATTFTESSNNDGSITTTATITLVNDTFTGANGSPLTSGMTVNNIPAGLTASLVKASDTTATLSLTGNATQHANANDVSNLQVILGNTVFTGGNAAGVTGATTSNLVVDFIDVVARSVSYSATTFTESANNDGSITTTPTITLTNDTFTGANGAALAGVTINGVPAGLTAVVTKTSATTATVGFTGTATQHTNANDVSNLQVILGDAAFTGGNAAGVTGATTSNLVVDFIDVVQRSVSYSTTSFTESSNNDGSITTNATITLVNDTFTGSNGASLASGMTVNNLPAGLTASLVKASATTATLSFSGSAASHLNANDVSNLQVILGDAVFTGGNAAGVTGSTNSNMAINFADTVINGTAVGNVLLGTAADNIIYGGGGADTIRGEAGNDTIDITDTGATSLNSANIVFTSTANGTDTIVGFSAAVPASGGDVLDFSAIAGLTDSVATGQTLATDFGANNVFIFSGTPVAIADAASAIAADATVVATQGYIVIADPANNNAATVYHSTDLAANGAETALAVLSGINIVNLTAANFIV